MDDDYFKVNMVNTLSNHEQVILRNDGEVYVVTPSLNKSYKFVSEWPYNSSQSYILNSLLKDIEEKANSNYEDQIKFLVGQIEHLEKELLQYSEQLEKLRAKILELNQKLFNKSMAISKLRELACTNSECKFRQYCTDDLKLE